MSQEKRLRKYDEGVRRMQQKRRNEKEKALDCMVQHVEIFHEQAMDEVTADFAGNPLPSAVPYAGECSFNWTSIMGPLLDDSIINIQLGCREHQDGQENGR